LLKTFIVTFIFGIAAANGVLADECDAVIADFSGNIVGLEIDERITSSDGRTSTVQLKNPAADSIQLRCPASGLPAQIEITWHSAYPPPAFFDFVSATGAILTSVSAIVARRAALNCQKQALALGVEDGSVDLGDVHFSCHVTANQGGATVFRIFLRPIAPSR
jgi:hypothetical protein